MAAAGVEAIFLGGGSMATYELPMYFQTGLNELNELF